MSLALAKRIQDRAHMLAQARSFFKQRNVLEVDVPILSERASVDTHIDLVQAKCLGKRAFLHSSPEYGMKRLLAKGIGDIYQISHVFRNGERGERHNPEFTMVEWYRCGFSLEEMIEETINFIHFFLEVDVAFERLSYRDAFAGYSYPATPEERDHLFAFEIEPHLKKTVIRGFPPEQAALSQIDEDGLAERFELFYQGVELANGYHELLDPIEQKKRFEKANEERQASGKEKYPMDDNLLEALDKVPDCCGVAVGFDRLMMLRHDVSKIDEVIPFAWEES